MENDSHLKVFIPGHPKPTPRGRARALKIDGKWVGRVHKDETKEEPWADAVINALERHVPERPLDQPVFLSLQFIFPRPGRLKAKIRAFLSFFHVTRPDVDNLTKFVMDRMKNLGFWVDDTRVSALLVVKRHVDDGGRCGCMLQMSTLPSEAPTLDECDSLFSAALATLRTGRKP